MSAGGAGFIPPMLASPGALFTAEDWFYEPKWDGIRCVASFDGQLRLFSRNGREIGARFPEIAALPASVAAKSWVLDGELIVLAADGRPSFDLVRDRNMQTDPAAASRLAAQNRAVFALFDLLFRDGRSLLAQPFRDRRELLQSIVARSEAAIVTPGSCGGGEAYYAAMVQAGMEGVVMKKLDSVYQPGQRSRQWVKVRATRQTDCVIGGYVPKGTTQFGSLLLGQYAAEDRLLYVGHVGTGFSAPDQLALLTILRKLHVPAPALQDIPRASQRGVTWVAPSLVCMIEFLNWTPGGVLRQPVFRSLRTDKGPEECLLDQQHPAPEVR